MARRRPPRRRRRPRDEPDWVEELDGEGEGYFEEEEEERYPRASQAIPITTILVIVAIGLTLIFAVVIFRKATTTAAQVVEEDVEGDIKDALMAVAVAQDVFWRDMGLKHAQSLHSLYYDYKKRTGVGPAVLSRKIARASSPQNAYHGYYFVSIGYEADGKAVDPRKSWAIAAVPAVNDEYHVYTYIINKQKLTYARDTGGQPPRAWPRKEDINVEGGWIRR